MGGTTVRSELILEKLKETGHRITPQLIAILRILAESRGHPSVEDIYEKVRVNFPNTSLATVYKTITVIKELGEVLELEFSNEQNRYDGNNPCPRPHLICVRWPPTRARHLGCAWHVLVACVYAIIRR